MQHVSGVGAGAGAGLFRPAQPQVSGPHTQVVSYFQTHNHILQWAHRSARPSRCQGTHRSALTGLRLHDDTSRHVPPTPDQHTIPPAPRSRTLSASATATLSAHGRTARSSLACWPVCHTLWLCAARRPRSNSQHSQAPFCCHRAERQPPPPPPPPPPLRRGLFPCLPAASASQRWRRRGSCSP